MSENRWSLVSGYNQFLLILAGGVLLIFLTIGIPWRMSLPHFFVALLITFWLGIMLYMTAVRFHSPLAIAEDGTVMTTFDSRAEVVHDARWNVDLGIVFVGGYNAAKRLLSYKDVNAGRGTIWVTPDPSMIESVGNGRFLLVRGTPYETNMWEAREFLRRPSIKAALGEELRSARVFWCYSSKTLKPDEMPADATRLGELSSLYEMWHGEIEESVTRFSEEFLRKFSIIRDVKTSPNVEKVMKQKTEEETPKQ